MLAVGEDLRLAGRKIEQCDLKLARVARDVRKCFSIRAYSRRDIIAPLECDALRLAPGGGHAVDLRAAAPVGGEVDRLTVWREARLGVDAGRAREAAHAAAVGVHHEELRAA